MEREKEFERLIDNFYEVERMIGTLEKAPKTYNTDYLLYYNEAHTLQMIAEHEGINQKELSGRMFRTKGATSIMIEKLVKKGLIEKRLGERDQRTCTLYLTEEGRKVHVRHKEYDAKRLDSWIHGMDLSAEELEIANRVIEECLRSYLREIGKPVKEGDI